MNNLRSYRSMIGELGLKLIPHASCLSIQCSFPQNTIGVMTCSQGQNSLSKGLWLESQGLDCCMLQVTLGEQTRPNSQQLKITFLWFTLCLYCGARCAVLHVVTLQHVLMSHLNIILQSSPWQAGPKLEDLAPAAKCSGSEVIHITTAHKPQARMWLHSASVTREMEKNDTSICLE